MRILCTVIGILLLLGLSLAAAPLEVKASIDSSAIPLLVNIEIHGGRGSVIVTVRAEDPRGENYSTILNTAERRISVPIPWNRRQVIHLSIEDSVGNRADESLACESRIRQDQPFTLDASRYQSSLQKATWHQQTGTSDDKLHAETIASISTSVSGSSRVVAPWPGQYIFGYGENGPKVEVTVSPTRDFNLDIRGMCDDYDPRPVGYSYLDVHLPRMAADGINAVQFIKKLTMKDLNSNIVYDPTPYPDWDRKLACAIQQAKSAGFKVMLRLVLFLEADWPEADATMQALYPSDWNTWFENYSQYALRYADLAEATGVDIYQFAESLHTTYSHESSYRNLIKAIRKRFSGSLLVTTGPWYKNGLDTVGFWDALDYIGICGSFQTFGLFPYSSAIRMTTDEVYEVYKSLFEREVLPTARRFGKRVLCAEVYYPSVVGSTYSPSGVPNWGTLAQDLNFKPQGSYTEQVRGYDAYMRVVENYMDIYAGVFALQWCLQDPTCLSMHSLGTHNIYATPAEGLFALWWDDLPSPQGRPVKVPGCPMQYEVGGFWFLKAFGDVQTEVFNEGEGPIATVDEYGLLDVDPNSPIDLKYWHSSNSRQGFCILHLYLGEPRDLSNYSGVVLMASADPPTDVSVELDFGDWIPCIADPITLGSERSSYLIPFSNFRIDREVGHKYGLGETDIDFAHVGALTLRIQSSGSMIHIDGFSLVR